jgi:hypothetical protein
LTISGFPSNPENLQATPALYRVLSHLFPIVTLRHLTLDALNNTPFRPMSKDEDLHSGLLQQPKGAILLLTEGAVTEGGILNEGKFVPRDFDPKTDEMILNVGVMNIRSVQQMMNYQTLEYSFPFSGFEFETDVNVIITTEGRQSTFFEVSELMSVSLNVTIHDYFRRTSTFPLDLQSRRV